MSLNDGFYIQKHSDKKLIDTLQSVIERYEHKINSLHFQISGLEGIQINKEQLIRLLENPVITKLHEADAFLIKTLTLNLNKFNVVFTRSEALANSSPLFDGVQVTLHGQSYNGVETLNNEGMLDLVTLLQRELCPVSIPKLLTNSLPEEYNAIFALHNQQLSELEKLSARIISDTHQKQLDLYAQHETRLQHVDEKLESESQKLEKEFSEKTSTLEQQIANEKQRLEEKLEQLRIKEALLDDRNNTHVRREIRDDLLEDVKTRMSKFEVSDYTAKNRTSVRNVFIALIFLLGTYLVLTLAESLRLEQTPTSLSTSTVNTAAKNSAAKEIKQDAQQPGSDNKINSTTTAATSSPSNMEEQPDTTQTALHRYYVWARCIVVGFFFFWSIYAYIKWLDKWASQLAKNEFQLRQFSIDINRANWVIESCLEWKKATQSEIPPELLNAISKNLFLLDETEQKPVMHPSDELASALLGSASKLKLNANGNEIEFNKPSKI